MIGSSPPDIRARERNYFAMSHEFCWDSPFGRVCVPIYVERRRWPPSPPDRDFVTPSIIDPEPVPWRRPPGWVDPSPEAQWLNDLNVSLDLLRLADSIGHSDLRQSIQRSVLESLAPLAEKNGMAKLTLEG